MPTPLAIGFATYPTVDLMNDVTDKKTKKKKFSRVKELLFGDYLRPLLKDGQYETRTVKGETYIKVRARGRQGYIQADQIQPNRILEVNFVDIGQGDGMHLVTPDDKHFIIDAGQHDNMYRFLKWRFNLKKAKHSPPPFDVVISHSDADHYAGFRHLFTETPESPNQFSIKTVYHNGLIERSGSKPESLGKLEKGLITEVYETDADAKAMLEKQQKPGMYIQLLKLLPDVELKGLNRSKVHQKEVLHEETGLEIEVLGPFVETLPNGTKALKVFDSNKGKTKNGHSVILLLRYGKMKILLGGDLNTHSEDYLLSKYTGADVAGIKAKLAKKGTTAAERELLMKELEGVVNTARQVFEVDVAKSCHHGSSDFTAEFLRALNATATVISSGDEESHCHPRPDTLGTVGKHSHGERSLIFSTELARSTLEFLDLTKVKNLANKSKERVVTVYGMINLRTDGDKAIIAQKLERRAPRGDWDVHCLEWDSKTGKFEYLSKH